MIVKRILYMMMPLFLCFGMGARAANVITISSAEGAPGNEVTLSIGLENSDAVSTMQVSIPLDENLTLIENSGQLGSRCSSHSLTVGVKDGVLNIFVYSLSMAAITGNSGEVANFKLKLGNQPTTIVLTPSKMVLTSSAGQTLDASANNGEVTIRCAKAQYSTMEVDFGEVPIRSSYERTVTVQNVGNADLTITGLLFSDVNVFSSTTSLPLTLEQGASRELNITYAPMERGNISKTLKVECNSISKLNTIALKAKPFKVNELHVQNASGISDEEVTVRMTMNNMDAISGYQVEFDLPEQFEYVDNSFTLSSRKQDHVSTASLSGRKLRIIAYSPTDKPFTGDDGEIGSFKVKLMGRYGTMLTPTKTVLSATINNKVENVVSDVYGGMITISSPTISSDGTLDFGAIPVTEDAEKVLTVYNYGSAPLTISRVVFNNENLSIKESLPITIGSYESKNLTVVYNSLEQTSFNAVMQIYSNDPEKRLHEVYVTGSRYAPNALTMTALPCGTNDNLEVVMHLDNYDAIGGLQFDMVYPNLYYSVPENNVTLATSANGMTVTKREIDQQTVRYFCYFLDGKSIPANAGDIMTIMYAPKTEVPIGSYNVQLINVKLGTGELSDKNSGADLQISFTVEPAIVVKAVNVSREYGASNPTFDYTVEGGALQGTPEISCEATVTSSVGIYDIVISKGSITNHKVSFEKGTLTITPAPLTVKGGTYTKKQGEANPEFILTYEGLKNSETDAVLTTKPTATCEAVESSAPGEYPVTVSGGAATNYTLSYVNGKLIVTDADAIVITANNQTRVYGEANPEFTYTVSGATLTGTPEISCSATATSPVGTYDIIISKGSVTNYNDSYVNGTLTITKAPLTVTVGEYSREQGQENPEFILSYSGWKNNENESVLITKPVATTTATTDSPVGEYPITINGGEAQNYEFTYVDGILTVIKANSIIMLMKSGKTFDVYTIEGRKVRHQTNTLEGLPKGVYIIAGKKVVIK